MIIKKHIVVIFYIISFGNSFSSMCQREVEFHGEASAILGTETTPFWMRANHFGIIPTKAQTAVIFVGAHSDYKNQKNTIDWGYGYNVGGFAGMENKFIIQEAFVKAKWKAFEIYGGRRKEIMGLVDTTLSSGSYIWSGNALPMPKIQISIQEYTTIGPSGIFSIKGNYAHGWFENTRADAKGAMLHQKSFYFRLGKPNYKMKFYAGLNHQAQWGGKVLFPDTLNIYSKNGRFGSSFRDYFYLITGRSTVGGDTAQFAGKNEVLNRVGNHLGTLDFAFELNFNKVKLMIYRQNIFEDGSLFYLNNITDGLNGLSFAIKNNSKSSIKINKIVIEFLNTLSQGGENDGNPEAPESRGYDNYFNNSQFRDGWSYNNTSIGTPFLLNKFEYPNNYVKPFESIFTNNKVQAYYLGLNGNLFDQINFETKFSFSKNWGSIVHKKNQAYQTSIGIKLDKNFTNILGGISTYVNFAVDSGEILSQNIGLRFGFIKTLNSLPFLHSTHTH